MSAGANEYLPDYAVAPGEVLAGAMEDSGLSACELAERSGLRAQKIGAILEGGAAITEGIARALEAALGRPARFWTRLEILYREDMERIAKGKSQ
ncbi:MAG: hypothetical protein FWE09_00090 [Treponema sp.]|nr:hypothetical protein [Treponema sp.]